MPETTVRFALPLLAQGQAQKELTHNEALTLADLLLAPIVESVAPSSVPASPAEGQGWIVGASPSGDWTGQANALAFWTDGGWRFIPPRPGMTLWSLADSLPVRWTATAWLLGEVAAAVLKIGSNQVVGARLAGVTSPSGGSTIDTEARAAIAAILSRLETHGLISA